MYTKSSRVLSMRLQQHWDDKSDCSKNGWDKMPTPVHLHQAKQRGGNLELRSKCSIDFLGYLCRVRIRAKTIIQ